jgi:hypothetical protein
MPRYFVPHKVEADQLWCRARIEVALDGIAGPIVQLGHGLCLGENRLADSTAE